MAKIAVAVIHGMGSQKPEFAEKMIKKMGKHLKKKGVAEDDIAWQPIYWADITEKRQREYFDEAKKAGDLDWRKVRKFMLTAFGDASAYRKTKDNNNKIYDKIHARIDEGINTLAQNVDRKKTPLIWMAHSLGGHIMSNYIYDIQKAIKGGTEPRKTRFRRMETLTGVLTFGCNIPLFTFAYEKDQVKPITLPKKARWFNYYDPDDVLGYPLKPISPAYEKTVDEDMAINAGGILTSWNPLSHSEYWTDSSFTKRAATFLKEVIDET